ncbi:hypothetical protein [Burkholderia sp. L27(2015)]|uniref:hypothetical protein n=1 Tax=Burkholderia sp. L27(2015) TaxID=1641858 RepID=UPI00131C4CCF|nr:hypothetical protein [Burkholderia sp. L27(2015)]
MPVMTWEKLLRRIEEGRGSGHGDAYQPWLWIHRKNPSKRGNQVAAPLPGYRRTSHFLAVIERHTALLCLFLGAQDVREQFPMWPMPHLHPLAGVPGGTGCGYSSLVRGLLDIASEANIPHGFEVGSGGVPYVATLDLGVTLRSDDGPRFAGISLKPHDEILAAEPSDRILERLKLEDLYLIELCAHYKIVDRSVLGEHTCWSSAR